MPKMMSPEKKEPNKTPEDKPHPLASLVGAWKDTEKLKTLMEGVEEYRREVETKEKAGI